MGEEEDMVNPDGTAKRIQYFFRRMEPVSQASIGYKPRFYISDTS